MRTGFVVIVLLGLVATATAQTPPAFGNFACACQPGSPALFPTPSLLGPPSVSVWRGNVYALSDADARFKAKNACLAENRGSQSICDACRCAK